MSEELAPWFAMSALLRQGDLAETLGERFGAEGPYLWVGLLCEASLQRRGGRVQGSLRDLAHDCFLEGGRARAAEILSAIGETDVIEIDALDSRAFVIRISNWRRWQEKFRKAKSRADATGHEGTPPDRSGREGTRSDATVARTKTYTNTDTKTHEPSANASGSEHTFELPVNPLQPYPAALTAVAKGKGRALNESAVVKACKDFSDRGLELEADKFRHYWLDGAGQNRKMKDIAGSWRNWLRSAPPAGTAGRAADNVASDLARLEEERLRLLGEEAHQTI